MENHILHCKKKHNENQKTQTKCNLQQITKQNSHSNNNIFDVIFTNAFRFHIKKCS